METIAVEAEVVTPVNPSESLATELSKQGITDAQIEKYRADYMGLTIAGVDDKDGYALVKEARQTVKKTRVAVDKIRKNLIEPHLKIQKAINAEAERITDLLEPIESYLKKQEDEVEAELERQRQERERAKQTKIHERTQQVLNLGMRFVGNTYTLGAVEIDVVDIKGASDENWDAMIAQAEEENRAIEERRAAEEAERIAEAARLEQQRLEQEAERKRLAAEQAEIDQQRQELENQKRKAKEEADAIVLENRSPRLTELGFERTGKGFRYDTTWHYTDADVIGLTSAEFEAQLSDFTAYRDEKLLRKQQEQEQAEKKRQEDEAAAAAELKRKQKEDKARQTRLKGDKKLFLQMLAKIEEIPYPAFTQDETKALRETFGMRYRELLSDFRNQLENL